MGGLIIRAAFPHFERIFDKFWFFISFSSPHLGYMYNSSTFVDAGMWFIKTFKKSQCMKELTMTDFENAKKCFIYRLSKNSGFEFKHICLVGSHQDKYVPFESARIEIEENSENDKKRQIYAKMAKNIIQKVQTQKIYRINADFNTKTKNLDDVIGRAAHMQMLENNVFISMVIHSCAEFFAD